MKRAYNNWTALAQADNLIPALRARVTGHEHPELGAALGLLEVSSFAGVKVAFTGRFKAKVRKAALAGRVDDIINLKRTVWV